jgi:hypothetical protein
MGTKWDAGRAALTAETKAEP